MLAKLSPESLMVCCIPLRRLPSAAVACYNKNKKVSWMLLLLSRKSKNNREMNLTGGELRKS